MKNFTNNFKQFTSRLSARWLIMALMLLLGTSSALADGDASGSIGVYLKVNGTSTWYKVYNPGSWEMSCSGYAFDSASEIPSAFGDITSSLSLEGVGVIGWTNSGNDWVAGKISYTITPGSVSGEYKVGNYGSAGSGKTQVQCTSDNNRLTGYKSTVNLISGLAVGDYTLKITPYAQMQWNDGSNSGTYNSYTRTAKSSTFTIPGYSTTSGNHSFGEVDLGSQVTKTIDLTHYGSDNDASVSITGTNKSEFTATIAENGNNQQTLTVTFKPTSVAQDKTATITVTDAYNKTYTLTVTGTGKQSCDPPAAPDFGSVSSAEYCYGDVVSFPTINGVTLKWYDEETGGNVVESPETNVGSTNYYAAAVEECESTERTQYTITIKTKPTVSLNPTENTVCTDVTLGDITDYVEIESTNGSQISWYAAAQGGDALATSTPLMETSYFAEATFNGCSSDRAEFTITDVLSAPTEVPNVTTPETICDGESAVLELNNKGANYTYSVNGEEVDFTNNEYTVYPTSTTDYTVSVENKCGSLSTTKTIAVNPLPTITSISASNDEPVPFEDVVLTATGVTQGAEVKWYLDNDETPVATGTTYVVTSENAVDVIVKAKAFLNGCESAVASHTVNFSSEDCEPEIITHTNKTKVRVQSPWSTIKIYAHSGQSTGDWPGVNMTAGTGEDAGYYVYTFESVSSNFKVIFNNGSSNGENQTVSGTATKSKVCTYTIGANSCSEDNNSRRCLTVTTSDYKTTAPAQITAPAVKMISAEYDEENDVIVAKGAVYKTGCDVTFWGFQYSEDGQTWGTADADYIRPSSGNSLTQAGEFDYSFPIPDANGGETYYIRAYALNNYNNDNYDLSSAEYSTTSLPVEIPSKTIESATISLVDSEGNALDVTEVCPQSTVYLKVSYAGGDFTDFVAEENFPGTDLELVNHDKTNNYAIFSFTATAAGTANITISNKSGSTVTPADGVSITLKDVQVVTPPIITINPESAMICQGDDATISIVEENQNYTYTIYKDGEALNPQSFTITEAGVYTVGATENECNTSATSMPIELKVVSSDVKIGLEADNTAIGPWQPLKLTVTPAKGYEYSLEGLDGMVYTKEGDVYTIKIPRPNDWSPGNSGTQLETENKVFTAKIKVSDEVSCGSKEVTVTLTDTEENCE